MKREKLLLVVIVFLLLIIATFGFVLFSQNKQIKTGAKNNQPSVSLVAPEPVKLVSVATASGTLVSSARFQFGPLISPDGQWLLAEEHNETPEDIIDVQTHTQAIPGYSLRHILFVANLYGHSDRIIVPQILEYRDKNANAVSGYPLYLSWMPAGWSPDGQTVYFVTKGSVGGNFSNIISQTLFGGKTLKAIRISDLNAQSILSVDDLFPDNYYILDIFVQKNMALVGGQKIFLTNLDGSGKKELYTLQSTEEIKDTSAIFDSTGSRIVLATGGQVATAQDTIDCGHTLRIIDLKNLSAKIIPTPNSCWSLVGWADNNTLRIQVENKDIDIKIK